MYETSRRGNRAVPLSKSQKHQRFSFGSGPVVAPIESVSGVLIPNCSGTGKPSPIRLGEVNKCAIRSECRVFVD